MRSRVAIRHPVSTRRISGRGQSDQFLMRCLWQGLLRRLLPGTIIAVPWVGPCLGQKIVQVPRQNQIVCIKGIYRVDRQELVAKGLQMRDNLCLAPRLGLVFALVQLLNLHHAHVKVVPGKIQDYGQFGSFRINRHVIHPVPMALPQFVRQVTTGIDLSVKDFVFSCWFWKGQRKNEGCKRESRSVRDSSAQR